MERWHRKRGKSPVGLTDSGKFWACLFLCLTALLLPGKASAAENEYKVEQVFINMPQVTAFYQGGDGNVTASLGGEKLSSVEAPRLFKDSGADAEYYIFLDISASVPRSRFEDIRSSLTRFCMDRRDQDRILLFTFGDTVTQILDGTENRTQQVDAIAQLENHDQNTVLFEALDLAAQRMVEAGQNSDTRRLAVVLSDGKDCADNQRDFQTMQNQLTSSGIELCTLVVENNEGDSPELAAQYQTLFSSLARSTGGSSFICGNSETSVWTGLDEIREKVLSGYWQLFTASSNRVSKQKETFTLDYGDGHHAGREILVDRSQPDLEAPTALLSRTEQSNEIQVEYSEKVQNAGNPGMYQLLKDGAAVPVLQVIEDSANVYRLVLASGLEGGSYSLRISDKVTDFSMEENPVQGREALILEVLEISQTEMPVTELPQTELPQIEAPQTETPQTELLADESAPSLLMESEVKSTETVRNEDAPEGKSLNVYSLGKSLVVWTAGKALETVSGYVSEEFMGTQTETEALSGTLAVSEPETETETENEAELLPGAKEAGKQPIGETESESPVSLKMETSASETETETKKQEETAAAAESESETETEEKNEKDSQLPDWWWMAAIGAAAVLALLLILLLKKGSRKKEAERPVQDLRRETPERPVQDFRRETPERPVQDFQREEPERPVQDFQRDAPDREAPQRAPEIPLESMEPKASISSESLLDPARQMDLVLWVDNGRDAPRDLKVRLDRSLIVGRSDSTDLRFEDPAMSKQHFALEMDAGVLYLSDLESKNGTFVNGVQVTARKRLEKNDEISAGNMHIRIMW